MAKTERTKPQGEYPPDYGKLPGEILLDDSANPKGLREAATERLESNPEIIEKARELGQDVVAFSRSHGKIILIGFGIALTASIGGIIFYQHRHQKK